MGELGTIFSKPDAGRTDDLGHREFIIDSKAGSKGSIYYSKRPNPWFSPPKVAATIKINTAWYRALITKLRQERQKQRMTQKQLAKTLKTRQSVISQFENGHLNPSLLFLIRYSAALGTKISFNIST